jgi:hypothetical protein
MDDSRAARLVQAALRCYPARWRRRHGDEATELAALLIRDGVSVGSIAWSYLAGAVREWLTPRPGRRLSIKAAAAREWVMPRPGRLLSTVAFVVLVAICLLGVSAGMLASAGPARAASTSQAGGHARAASTSQAPGHARAASGSQAGGHARAARGSQAGGPSPCQPGSPELVPGGFPAGGRQQVIIGVAGHGQSC